MKSCLMLARRGVGRRLVPRLLAQQGCSRLRCLATLPPPPPLSTNPPPPPMPFAVDAPDGTCQQVDEVEEQRVVNDMVETQAQHAFERHLEQDHVDFYGPDKGPLQAMHPPVLSRNRRQDKVTPQHLLAVTPDDVMRAEKEEFLKVAVCLEDLYFIPNEKHYKATEDPNHYAAVDAPDGTSDDSVLHDLEEVERLIDEAAENEDDDFIQELHARQADAARIFAVDAPDGLPDDEVLKQENLGQVEHLIQQASENEDKEYVEKLHALQQDAETIFAVDAPDGLPDIANEQELVATRDILEYSTYMRDPEFVAVLRNEQQEISRVFAVDAPDGTSDAAVEDDLHFVEEVIDHAAQHEDKDEILRVHKENEEIKQTLSQPFPKGPFNMP